MNSLEAYYLIRVRGALDPAWQTWFDGMTITTGQPENETHIEGIVPDQTALHSLLTRIRDLNLILIAVESR